MIGSIHLKTSSGWTAQTVKRPIADLYVPTALPMDVNESAKATPRYENIDEYGEQSAG